MVPNSNRIHDLEQMHFLYYVFSMIYVSIKTKINLMVKRKQTQQFIIYKYFSNKWSLKKKVKECDLESRLFYKPRMKWLNSNVIAREHFSDTDEDEVNGAFQMEETYEWMTSKRSQWLLNVAIIFTCNSQSMLQDFALCPTQDHSYKNTIKFTSDLIQNVLNKVESGPGKIDKHEFKFILPFSVNKHQRYFSSKYFYYYEGGNAKNNKTQI